MSHPHDRVCPLCKGEDDVHMKHCQLGSKMDVEVVKSIQEKEKARSARLQDDRVYTSDPNMKRPIKTIKP